MRIAGYIDHPHLKITIFQHEGRFSIQFETPHYLQTFKVKIESGIDTIEKVNELIDPEFISMVSERFADMHKQMNQRMDNLFGTMDANEFEEII